MKVYEAIKEMRRMSGNNEPFSFSYMSYSIDTGKSGGVIEVQHALLVHRSKASKDAYADHKLLYKDLDTNELRQCWQPLLMTLNNKDLEGIE
jgi:hypothetical protein